MPEKKRFAGPDPPETIPSQLRRVNNLIGRKVNANIRRNSGEDITPMHGWILGFLYNNREMEVCQRDIEQEFSITRSTVTNILQLMERKGYILRCGVERDKRLKQIVLTQRGKEAFEKIILSLHETEGCVRSLLTEKEQAELLTLLDRLIAGLS